jgi:hypothetical protein
MFKLFFFCAKQAEFQNKKKSASKKERNHIESRLFSNSSENDVTHRGAFRF